MTSDRNDSTDGDNTNNSKYISHLITIIIII